MSTLSEVLAELLKVTHYGKYITLRPIDIEQDCEELFEASSGKNNENNHIWKYTPHGPFEKKEQFKSFLEIVFNRGSAPYVVIDNKTNEKIGMICYLNINAVHKTIEIGTIWYTPKAQGTFANTEACYLLIKYAFENMGYRRMEWKCDVKNEKSKAAAKRLGFQFEGVFRNHMLVKGMDRDTAYFSIINREWNDVKNKLHQMLKEDYYQNKNKNKIESKL